MIQPPDALTLAIAAIEASMPVHAKLKVSYGYDSATDNFYYEASIGKHTVLHSSSGETLGDAIIGLAQTIKDNNEAHIQSR